MLKEDCKIGMRVVCPEQYFNIPSFKGRTGTIVCIEDYTSTTEIGVEWDELVEVITNSRYNGHSCNGRCTDGYGYYGYANDVEPFNPSVEDEYDFKISIESLF